MIAQEIRQAVTIKLGDINLKGDLIIPENPAGIVLFSHGSGSSRLSPRNNYVAEVLQGNGLATLLFDLLTEEEERINHMRFDIDLLTRRLIGATKWIKELPETNTLPIGYFGASIGAASALRAAAFFKDEVSVVVSRGGRPDLAMKEVDKVTASTLLIVGGNDELVIKFNKKAFQQMQCDAKLEIIPGASHLFAEPGALEQVAKISANWFNEKLT
ncbi:MAG: dienelactone hydrolase family protein [Bacteroidia bacterium]|nr:dienelactone hydrolase family protein [Bacteroidia bacterium]NNF30118.1 alpha/beta hydrolase [Flavobacteriaceae bacterium]MBT8274996.1 dienelactone hydrolase family protein [Bacteroidia bacterium]NNJ80584.1 alpha/beta hydrolase [Flavobacteriaceae bacterium]NNK55519.1 alpha/beta hydrolase [Flavobacteriaceae bacterium]